ncbi:hypothetical protein WDW37_08730 [Bdellovibrionota bacterium FG-1]
MRRMREFKFGRYIAFALPVFAGAFGAYYYVKHRPVAGPPSTAETAEKTSDRKVASLSGEKDRTELSHRIRDTAKDVEDEVADSRDQKSDQDAPVASKAVAPVTAAATASVSADPGKECTFSEYCGEGPEYTRVTKAEWAMVMDKFHGAKSSLIGWLGQHRSEIPEATYATMEKQVRGLKIQRPPSSDEPDLAWRGIGVYSQAAENSEPILKIGGGFVQFASRNPARAKFELARLVAQSWAPCELGRVGGEHASVTWAPLLKCLGVNDAQGCTQGTYSEAGWAVSTTVAAITTPPGCEVKAFRNPEMAKCMKEMPFEAGTRSVASSGTSGVASKETK